MSLKYTDLLLVRFLMMMTSVRKMKKMTVNLTRKVMKNPMTLLTLVLGGGERGWTA